VAGQKQGLFDQALDLLCRIQVRLGARRPVRQQVRRWNLGAWVAGQMVAREASHIAQALCPMGRQRVARLLGPGQRQFRRDELGLSLFHERGEIQQRDTGVVKLEPQASPQC